MVSGLHATYFADLARQAGIDHTQTHRDFVPEIELEILTGGAAAGDFDGDGWVDLFVTRLDNRDILYRNLGATRGDSGPWFEDVTVAAGITGNDRTNGAAWADIDNDGDLDLMVGTVQSSRFYLYVNQGDGTFVEQAVERGVAMESPLQHRSFGITFGDFDRDGWIDIHICEWGIDRLNPASARHSVLLRNLGPKQPGHFINVTQAAKVELGNAQFQYAFSSSFSDLDGDHWPDLVVTGDFGTSQIFWNNADGTFTEGGRAAGVNLGNNEMGSAIADVDADGDLDWFVSSTTADNRLYLNQGDRRFLESAAEYRIQDGGWGWGTAWMDHDNDGDFDLILTNGWWPIESPEQREMFRDPIAFWEQEAGRFRQVQAWESGLHDDREGKGLLLLDFDRDGDMDVFVANHGDFAHFFVNQSDGKGHWLQLVLRGTRSNTQGIGAKVWITARAGDDPRLFEMTGHSHFLGQSEAIIHAGLGAHSGPLHELRILWPSGTEQVLTDVEVNQRLEVVEQGQSVASLPTIEAVAVEGSLEKDAPLTLQASAQGQPNPFYVWYKDGAIIEGATGPTYAIRHLKPFHEGVYTVVVSNAAGQVESAPMEVHIQAELNSKSVAQWWNEALLDGIRLDYPDPPIHGRNLFHLSAVLWDAYWAYEPGAWERVRPVYHREVLNASDSEQGREQAQREAMSYAAYRLIEARYRESPGAAQTLKGIDWLMDRWGYDPNRTGTGGTEPWAVGNRIAAATLAATLNDGANEAGGYADVTQYSAVNTPMIVAIPGAEMNDPNRWQPLSLSFSVTQNGLVQGSSTQTFIGPNARHTTPFALLKPTASTIALDPGPPPLLGGVGHDALVQQVVEVIYFSSLLDPSDGVAVDISPGAHLNNALGRNDGEGYALNPATGEPYAPNVVLRADYGRILAEFWADGPDSETPPGHWNVLFNQMNAHPALSRRFQGEGEVLGRLEWDVLGYLALNGAMHDAATAAWTVKRQYDSSRPISLIRYMGGLGQSSDPGRASYHENGLPLIEGLIELTTAESVRFGGRHAGVQGSPSEGKPREGQVVIRAWTGNPQDPEAFIGGVNWIFAESWNPYQKNTFVTPAFPGYVSGHSTFSRAAAEVLTLLTGSRFFPGGMATHHFVKDAYLVFERGPEQDLTLQWATFQDAADQAGISRIWGGIHIAADDIQGRVLGDRVGKDAFAKTIQLYGR